ncbi:AAA family ATPase [Cystobacter fuscus]
MTDNFSLSIKLTENTEDSAKSKIRRKERQIEWRLETPETETISAKTLPSMRSSLATRDPINKLNRTIADFPNSSVFFPTFRRIEGGFSMGGITELTTATEAPRYYVTASDSGPIEHALARLSDRISVRQHRFVSSISTSDIVSMLTKQYADTSEQINQDNNQRSKAITELIEHYRTTKPEAVDETSKLGEATKILEMIQAIVTEHKERQELFLRPFSALSDLISKIFKHKGIKVTSHLTLGEAGEAISSDALSAGEKQMLSFLAYNAFAQKSTIFIDEPEISLHVDWQRILFPTLLSQGSTNQFIVATHSPFIYSKYQDKELLLDSDRGGE